MYICKYDRESSPCWCLSLQYEKWTQWDARQDSLQFGQSCIVSFATFILVNYNISLTWIKAIWGWCPLLTMIPVRENSGVVIIYANLWRILQVSRLQLWHFSSYKSVVTHLRNDKLIKVSIIISGFQGFDSRKIPN